MDNDLTESPEEAARLDRLLVAATPPSVPAALERRILAEFDRRYLQWSFAKIWQRAAYMVWPDAPAWQPASVFGLAFVLGLGVAVLAPFDIPQQDDGSASVFALDGPPDVDAGHGL